MKNELTLIKFSLIIFLFFSFAISAQKNGSVEKYNVIWTSPSNDFNGSMPLGNGDVGINAWVDEYGDLFFYISKTDSWDDNGRLVKIGKVKISLNPKPEAPLTNFSQTLDLSTSSINICFDEENKSTKIQLWVDANNPIIHCQINSSQKVTAVASSELWRISKEELSTIEISDVMYDWSKENKQHEPTFVEADSILHNQKDQIGWFHQNTKSIGPDITAKLQGMDNFARIDPLLNRTFGAIIKATNQKVIDDTHIESKESQNHRFDIYVLTEHPASAEKWKSSIQAMIQSLEKSSIASKWKKHKNWWNKFWNKSWIEITSSNLDKVTIEDAFIVSQTYVLQRYLNACAGRGAFPIKFNGSIFTVPYKDKPGDADYRRWGPGYWWQNTRLPYYTMMTAADTDLIKPLFKMYAEELMPLFEFRTKKYFNHEGAYIPECIYFWGDVFTESYGWTPFDQRTDKLQESGWHKWEWVSGLELVYLMIDYFEHTNDLNFFNKSLLPTARKILTFFDLHYALDDKGKLIMHPSQALETWWECTNPMPEVAGLYSITERLLSFNILNNEYSNFLKKLRNKLPDIPTRVYKGTQMLAAAEKFAKKQNIENPELYSVFPFRLFTKQKPNYNLAYNALIYRDERGNAGWKHDEVFMTYLGLADSAKQYLIARAKNKNKESRFPAFWGPNYDWTPDQTHGGVLMKTLQTMVIQSDEKKIYLMPAWPKEWNVNFKLHAPNNTFVEGIFSDGKFSLLKVTPESRRKDVLIEGVNN